MATFTDDTTINGNLFASGSSKIMQVPRWDYNQVFIGSYPPEGSLMEIENLPGGVAGLYYSDGAAFWLVDIT
jgi:hypothetical protein